MYAWSLTLASDYATSYQEAIALLEDATEFRIDVALPYGHATSAAALAGLRRYDEALEHIRLAGAESRRCNDTNGEQNAYAIGVRVLLQAGRSSEACAIEPPDLAAALRGMKGEALASRALALELLDASRTRGRSPRCSISRQAVLRRRHCSTRLRCFWDQARPVGMTDIAQEMLEHGYRVGAVDPVVTAYRANSDLLSLLLATPATTERTVFILARAGDGELAEQLGVALADRLDPTSKLSKREREVYELVCLGLSNSEIGRRLFISEGTVKVHVHHVFDKLGIRSRTALALGALGQAAPRSSSGSDSEITE